MQNPLSRHIAIAKRWAWLMIIGVVICGGATYVVSKLIHPVYQASTTLILTVGTGPSAYDTTTATLEALPTYAKLIQTNRVLSPVVAEHPGLTVQSLLGMMTVNPSSNIPIPRYKELLQFYLLRCLFLLSNQNHHWMQLSVPSSVWVYQ